MLLASFVGLSVFAVGLLLFAMNLPLDDAYYIQGSNPPDAEESEEKVVYHWPLTNRVAPDDQVISRRPIAMKIDNSSNARPQSGLIDADIIYETEVEGGVTRFNAIFHSRLPESVGPQRSARESDIWVVPQWDAYLLYSGASNEVNAKLANTGLDVVSEEFDPRIWERVPWRFAPHNLYVRMENVPEAIGDFGIDVDSWILRSLDFEEVSSDEATQTIAVAELSSITVPYEATVIDWTWDSKSQRFLRFQDALPHTDYVTEQQLGADNVIILVADYTNFDKGGEAILFKGGVRFDGTWSAGIGRPPELRDKEGRLMLYRSGTTWFEVVPLGTEINVMTTVNEDVVD